jgi:hypothetical protein
MTSPPLIRPRSSSLSIAPNRVKSIKATRYWKSYGAPLPESVQFERCDEVANGVFPVYRYLVELAADGKLFHIDDMRVRILSCYREDKGRSEKAPPTRLYQIIAVKRDLTADTALRLARYFGGRRN